jgi:hypothetical protein
MFYQATKKVPGGKLLRVKIQADATIIQAIQISGDFFLHPEVSITYIEKSLAGLPTASPAEKFAEKNHDELAKQKSAFIGVSAEDIAQAMAEAVSAGPTA